MAHRKVGVDCGEGPPVPIPNTEVKLTCAEDTWREAAWENKQMPTFFALIAQSVEHAAVNRSVTGSSPVWGAKTPLKPSVSGVRFFGKNFLTANFNFFCSQKQIKKIFERHFFNFSFYFSIQSKISQN